MSTSKPLSASEIASHNNSKDAWIIIDGNVYNVTEFANRHPGGDRILHMFAGQDASDAFHSFHIVPDRPRSMMNKFLVGRAEVDTDANAALVRDFRSLRAQLHSERMFDARPTFFVGWFAHILALEVAAALVAHWCVGWTGFVLCAVLLGVSQIQAGWLQHDFGHLAVFKSIWANDWAHKVTIMALKGASALWWKTRHNRHHAKTNVLGADPDIDNDPLFLLGERMVEQRRGWSLSRHQHIYWHFLGPPLVTTLLFIYQNLKFVQRRRLHAEKLWIGGYFVRFAATFGTAYGVSGCIALYFLMRLIESNWFTWVTSMSHLPMHIDSSDASAHDWITHTILTTQNLSGGTFNDWFTGHLNYQVEHHLFPTMPRHNYPLVAPRVAALCKKHNLPLRTRTLWEAANDVMDALQESAKLIEKKHKARAVGKGKGA